MRLAAGMTGLQRSASLRSPIAGRLVMGCGAARWETARDQCSPPCRVSRRNEDGQRVGAARVLNVSQPAVTKTLQLIESRIGVPLFRVGPVDDLLDDPPGLLDDVHPREVARVADEGVAEDPLVGGLHRAEDRRVYRIGTSRVSVTLPGSLASRQKVIPASGCMIYFNLLKFYKYLYI